MGGQEVKPRIIKTRKGWLCESEGRYCEHITITAAYNGWQAMRLCMVGTGMRLL